MLQAYFDAGLQPKTHVYYVAGYVAFPEDEAVSRRLTIVQPTDPARGYAEN